MRRPWRSPCGGWVTGRGVRGGSCSKTQCCRPPPARAAAPRPPPPPSRSAAAACLHADGQLLESPKGGLQLAGRDARKLHHAAHGGLGGGAQLVEVDEHDAAGRGGVGGGARTFAQYASSSGEVAKRGSAARRSSVKLHSRGRPSVENMVSAEKAPATGSRSRKTSLALGVCAAMRAAALSRQDGRGQASNTRHCTGGEGGGGLEGGQLCNLNNSTRAPHPPARPTRPPHPPTHPPFARRARAPPTSAPKRWESRSGRLQRCRRARRDPTPR